ncbi:MAG TPA: GNAT family N-acetyltransferase [Methyloceanibacter sp.]|nr:GNAT family N-acetyltransferase [Methyloceanibacter sp.]
MNAQAHPTLAVRPMLPGEAALLAQIFRASITELTGDDYTEMQQEAWMAAAEDEAAFAKRLGDEVTIVATLGGAPVGFGSLERDDKIGFLYVHPAVAGQGVGAALANALEKVAGGRGVATLKVDASDTASGFFAKRGYVPQQRNSVRCGDEWLANTTMHKPLGDGEAAQ